MKHQPDRRHRFVERRGRQTTVQKAGHAPVMLLGDENCDAGRLIIPCPLGPLEVEIVGFTGVVVGRGERHGTSERTRGFARRLVRCPRAHCGRDRPGATDRCP